ncbi:hypothetical protein K1T71_009224 [Dendrolimus kikuchii]|uniref:Uncharacterized protein n=1 Tax=Dendrolimus kikuchii TaxID=765133 RepID=A0ACC1CTW4_9NEOP|nr:hypothetical protein K1T71_009224 [Dendrolimus kikuchii]
MATHSGNTIHTSGTSTHSDRTPGDTSSNMDVFKVGVKIPPFWPDEPALWFAQIEGQFNISGITSDSTKFYHVISQLDQNHAAEVKDIIIAPPADNKYLKLKSELIKRLSASQEKKIKQLLMHEELGDRKPSQFLRYLQTLAGPTIPDSFLRTLWASRLPHNLQIVIAAQTDCTLETIADLADKVYEIAPSNPIVAATSTNIASSCLDEITKQISELTKEPVCLA